MQAVITTGPACGSKVTDSVQQSPTGIIMHSSALISAPLKETFSSRHL